MTDDLVKHLRKGEVSIKMQDGSVQLVNHVAADRIETLEAALREAYRHIDECCPHRIPNDARAALGEKKDE